MDYAIGAVIAKDDEIIPASGNKTKTEQNPINHAEVSAITEACKFSVVDIL